MIRGLDSERERREKRIKGERELAGKTEFIYLRLQQIFYKISLLFFSVLYFFENSKYTIIIIKICII